MPWGGPYTQLPVEVDIQTSSMPLSLTDQTTVDTEIAELVFNNTGASSTTVTVQSKEATPYQIINNMQVDPGVPLTFSYDPPAKLLSGFKWIAGAANVMATARGRKKTALTFPATGVPV